MKKCKKLAAVFLAFGLLVSGCGNAESLESQSEQEWSLADHSPYTPYRQTVVYSLAKLTGLDNMPEGDTYENNAYTRYLLDMINVQNQDVIEVEDTVYQNTINMFISSGQLPDVMLVDQYSDLQYLVEHDLIADLSTAYEECTTDRIKEIYQSYGNILLDNVTFDGKIMAVPETNIGNGPNLLWLRKDWMDALGLEDPKNLEDAVEIIRAFVQQDPGGNGEGNTIGLMINSQVAGTSGYTLEYSLDSIFQAFEAQPGQWVENEGSVNYGSLGQESMEALQYIHSLYAEGLIDPDFALRTMNNIHDVIISGKSGAFFGPWWAPNNPLAESRQQNPKAQWQCYLLPTSSEQTISYGAVNPCGQYVVVRKGFEHPEVVFKIISVIFDWLRFEDKDSSEVRYYDKNNVDQTARPLVINVDYNDALFQSHENIHNVLDGQLSLSDIPNLDAAYATACLNYLNNPQRSSMEDWAAYMSRMNALQLLEEAELEPKRSIFYGWTEGMEKDLYDLQQMEHTFFIRAILEGVSQEAFDDFVYSWKEQGGARILEEIQEEVKL